MEGEEAERREMTKECEKEEQEDKKLEEQKIIIMRIKRGRRNR